MTPPARIARGQLRAASLGQASGALAAVEDRDARHAAFGAALLVRALVLEGRAARARSFTRAEGFARMAAAARETAEACAAAAEAARPPRVGRGRR